VWAIVTGEMVGRYGASSYIKDKRSECRIGATIWPPAVKSSATTLFP
jgi:hypothetical protein